jgi:hypothetical protein
LVPILVKMRMRLHRNIPGPIMLWLGVTAWGS